jgi:hypothetical protein
MHQGRDRLTGETTGVDMVQTGRPEWFSGSSFMEKLLNVSVDLYFSKDIDTFDILDIIDILNILDIIGIF